MVVHLKHIDRYEEHKATVYFPRSPEAELPDKNSLWKRLEDNKEKPKEGGWKAKKRTLKSIQEEKSIYHKNICLMKK